MRKKKEGFCLSRVLWLGMLILFLIYAFGIAGFLAGVYGLRVGVGLMGIWCWEWKMGGFVLGILGVLILAGYGMVVIFGLKFWGVGFFWDFLGVCRALQGLVIFLTNY